MDGHTHHVFIERLIVEPVQTAGIANFLAQTDFIGRMLVFVLVLMSVATWYLIVTKALQILMTRQRTARFLRTFWDAPSLQSVATHLEQQHPDEPFSHLSWHAIVAARHHQQHGASKLDAAGNITEFLTRAMRRVIDEETARIESGLTVLASIGSTAPFIGLFGTVWGVYHALINIGISGQGTLDKVAGPVGEALIMTAAGLAVAIPAVLAYNAFVRSNRLVLAQLDSFAHDLFSFLTTGTHLNDVAPVTPLKPAAVTAQRGA
jgi:biopolymer transport protein ExbB